MLLKILVFKLILFVINSIMTLFENVIRLLEGKSGAKKNFAITVMLFVFNNIVALLHNLHHVIESVVKNKNTQSQSHSQSQNNANPFFTSKFDKKPLSQKRSKVEKKIPANLKPKKNTASNKLTAKDQDSKFAETLSKKRSELLYLVRGKDRGKEAWHYVLVDKMKLPVFTKKTQGGSLDVADYGKVLYSGWGQDPPLDIKIKIFEEFGGTDPRLED